MSVLAPLFMLGLAALSLPIIFHLIRRTPKGRHSFSSLMFLSPSPPKLTRRSRLDHIVLLLLRALALTLLALAFARPFLREAADLSLNGARGRRVAILVDTSASMRRGNLWNQAVGRVEQILSKIEAADDVALYTYDDDVTTIVDLEEKTDLPRDRKPALVKRRLAELGPTWAHTDLGSALVRIAEALDIANDTQKSNAALQIELVTDFQQGAEIQALQAYDWPKDVRLSVQRVSPMNISNASIQLLADEEGESDDDHQPRVRVINATGSSMDQFYVNWSSDRLQQDVGDEIAIYVPPGQSRVVRVPRPAESLAADRLALTGDGCEFDNVFYVVPLRQEVVSVIYLGSDAADDPMGLRYYLQLALAETPQRKVNVIACTGDRPLPEPAGQPSRLVVVTDKVTDQQLGQLENYLEQGGTVLVVPKDHSAAVSLANFVEVKPTDPKDTQVAKGDYVMLGEIDFSHPLFASFASPRYSDFTKIHFWNHREISVKDAAQARVVARFDNGQPALWEQPFGAGNVLVMSSGWHPEDSQLALSTKFVPLLTAVLEQAGGGDYLLPGFRINQQVVLPDKPAATTEAMVRRPDGSEFKLGSRAERFDGTDQPGIYHVQLAGNQYEFAVNVASSESQTTPMHVEDLEPYNVVLGTQRTQSEEIERQRQKRDTELEKEQKIWRWLIVVALGVLIFETWLAGKKSRPTTASEKVS